VSLPEARPGLVFRYEYAWKRQALAGQFVGEKERPAGVVLTVVGAAGDRRVLIGHPGFCCPKPTSTPGRPQTMRPIPGKPGVFAYGLLPLRLVNRIRGAILSALAAKRLGVVKRDEEISL